MNDVAFECIWLLNVWVHFEFEWWLSVVCLQKCSETVLRLVQQLEATQTNSEECSALWSAPVQPDTRQLRIVPCHPRHMFPRCIGLLVTCLHVRSARPIASILYTMCPIRSSDVIVALKFPACLPLSLSSRRPFICCYRRKHWKRTLWTICAVVTCWCCCSTTGLGSSRSSMRLVIASGVKEPSNTASSLTISSVSFKLTDNYLRRSRGFSWVTGVH